MSRRRTLKLSTPTQVRRAISRIANMALNGEVDPKTANTLIYACNSCLSSIRTDEQEKRLDELDALLREQEGK